MAFLNSLIAINLTAATDFWSTRRNSNETNTNVLSQADDIVPNDERVSSSAASVSTVYDPLADLALPGLKK